MRWSANSPIADQRDAVLHPDVVTLFGWHDGFDVARWNDDEVSLAVLPGFEFRPLNDTLVQFELSRSIGGDLSAKWGGLEQDRCGPRRGAPSCRWTVARSTSAPRRRLRIRLVRPLHDEKHRLFDSLSDAVEDVRAKLQAGTLTVTEGGLITGDWISEVRPGPR